MNGAHEYRPTQESCSRAPHLFRLYLDITLVVRLELVQCFHVVLTVSNKGRTCSREQPVFCTSPTPVPGTSRRTAKEGQPLGPDNWMAAMEIGSRSSDAMERAANRFSLSSLSSPRLLRVDALGGLTFRGRLVAEERGDATAKEKVLLPILACHFKEDTRTLFHIFGICQIKPEKGSRSTGAKKRTAVHPKILKLLKSLK
ncbi:hypothetical protein HPB47_010355 [Ixodes persulcatus]|uniref:Uncharacterized protein n=1 Tax=Ixodes persulcatus TaxID=34615 RepID=A0AC60NZB7_IXOPE|nr:hypothetical protein HPB47_010355 [Ixodes persulcatus]